MQFPGVWIGNCDLNLTGPERHLRTASKELTYYYDNIPLKDDDTQRPVHECLDELYKRSDEAAKNPDVKVLGYDSLTWINEYIIQKVLSAKGKNTTEMEIRDWQPFKSKWLELLFSHSRNSGKMVIMTVHELIIEEPDPKNLGKSIITGYKPSLNGSITDYFGAFFTDVWRCEARPAPMGKTEFYITTSRTTKSDLKNSLGLPPEMKADYKLIETYLNK